MGLVVHDILPARLFTVLTIVSASEFHIRLVKLHCSGQLVQEDMDKLCAWEHKLATDALASKARCSLCRCHSLLSIPDNGRIRQVIPFCTVCCRFCSALIDPSDYDQMPQPRALPILPAGCQERLRGAIAREDFDHYRSTLPNNKAPGPDGLPYELIKSGPEPLVSLIFEAVNVILTSADLTPLNWKGGLLRFLFKKGDPLEMSNYRPVCLLDCIYKLVSAIITDRLYLLVEKHGLLHSSQEGFRRLRNTQRQAQSLHWAFEKAKENKETLFCAYLDFENAFNSVDLEAVWRWLEALGIPDTDLLRNLYRGAHCQADLPYGRSAPVILTRGVKQGDKPSPLLFILTFNLLLLLLEETKAGHVTWTGRSVPSRGFADDVALVAASEANMQRLLEVVDRFCSFTGMRVKFSKSVITGYDFRRRRDVDTSRITYQGQPLPHLPAAGAFPYLGIRMSITGSLNAEMAHVITATRELLEVARNHRYNLDQIVPAMRMVSASRFRYSAPLVAWSDAALDRLHKLWIALEKAAWRLPKGFPAAPFLYPRSQGGCPVPHPRVHLVHALATHVEALVALPDDLRQMTVLRYRALCAEVGCHTPRELALVLSRERNPRACPIARLLRACGQLDITVKLPACLTLGRTESETSWYGLLCRIREAALAAGASAQIASDLRVITKRWTDIRRRLQRNGHTLPRSLAVNPQAAVLEWFLPRIDNRSWEASLSRLLQLVAPQPPGRPLFPTRSRICSLPPPEVHVGLVHDVLTALRDKTSSVEAAFSDDRWSLVRSSEPARGWRQLLQRHGLRFCEGMEPLDEEADVIRELCELGCDPGTPRELLQALVQGLAASIRSCPPLAPTNEHKMEEPLLLRDGVRFCLTDPTEATIQIGRFKVTTRESRARVDEIFEGVLRHVGTVAQGRFAFLVAQHGIDRVLEQLHRWISEVQRAEATDGVASFQFWHHLKGALGANCIAGAPALLSPSCFEESIDIGVNGPCPGCKMVYTSLTATPDEQRGLLDHLAAQAGADWVVLTRRSTLDPRLARFLQHRAHPIFIVVKGSHVVASKGSWSTGSLRSNRCKEAWTVWASQAHQDHLAEMQMRLEGLSFTKDGAVPLHLSCPSAREALLAPSGPHLANGLVVATDGSVAADGAMGLMGAGGCWLNEALPSFSFAVYGQPASIAPELEAIGAALSQAPQQDLTVLTDSLSGLQLLRKMQRSDFRLSLHGHPQRSIVERTVALLNSRARAGLLTTLVKVKAHAGDRLNEWADSIAGSAAERDPTRLPDLDPERVYYYDQGAPVRWGPRLRDRLTQTAAQQFMQSRQLRAQSRDAPGEDQKGPLLNFTESWLVRPNTGRSALGAALGAMRITAQKKRALQSVANAFPCNARLFKWKLASSADCTLCRADFETQSHIQCVCPALKDARIAAHHKVAHTLWAALEKQSKKKLTLTTETTVGDLHTLAGASPEWAAIWRRFFCVDTSAQAGLSLEELALQRPDAVAVCWADKRVFILEVTRAGDSNQDFQRTTDLFKTERYKALQERLLASAQRGWQVETLCFTIGVRASFNELVWQEHLVKLGVPIEAHPDVIKPVVQAALEGLDHLYLIRSAALKALQTASRTV
jgi:ribonuclease HI